MDKGRRDVRLGTSNRMFKNESELGCGFPGKSKKGRFKKLGLAGEVKSSHEEISMGCDFSPSSDREIATKKSKLPKRTFKDDANGVDHTSVPRKLRSAMKKRKCESVSKPSPASKKLMNRSKTGVVESPKKDCVKKENLEMESRSVEEPITKEEEEVAEMLYALAGMFPGVVTTVESCKVDDDASSETKASEFLPKEKDDRPKTVVKAAEEDSTQVPEPGGHKMVETSEAAVSVPPIAKTKRIDEMSIGQPENLKGSTGTLYYLGGSKPISANETEPPEKKLGIAFTTEAVQNKPATIDADYSSSGLALWPGLSSTVPQCSRDHLLPKPSLTRIPPCMGSAVSPSKKGSFRSDPSMLDLKKVKRCASHIYITHLIRVLQTTKIPPTMQQNKPIPSEGSECRVSDSMAVSDLKSVKNCLETVTTAGDAVNSSSKSYLDMFLLDNCRRHDAKLSENMTRLAVEMFGSQPSRKQSYEFLPLLPGDTRINTSEARIGAAPASAARIGSISQSCHISPAYNNQLPAAASTHQGRTQFPSYLAGPFQATHHMGSIAFSNHHWRHLQQQSQQRLWPAQCRQAGNATPLSQYTTMQNVRPELALNLNSQSKIQSLEQPFSTSYNIPQQQQRLMATANTMSMNHHPSRVMINRREQHFPLAYEETRTPLQLLCNEQS